MIMMKSLRFLFAALALVSCNPYSVDPQGQDGPDTPADPRFDVSGLPGSEVNANSTFILSVSSESKGAIDFSSSDQDVAFVSLAAKRQYKVAVKSVKKDTPVIVSFVQEACGDYAEARLDVSFTVLAETYEAGPTVPAESHPDLDGIKFTFTESVKPVVNPERGLYKSRNFYSSSAPLNPSEVTAQRLDGYSLWYLGFYLSDFMEGDIQPDFLEKFQACMDALRAGGSKCMLRFAYKDHSSDKEEMDPEVDVVLRHVEQLKPYLQKNADVIFVLQAGFVGPWGEWHSSTHFGNSFELRKKLMDALLDALPESRQVQVRTPQFKMRMYGLAVADTLTAAKAHDGSIKSRIAGHNDCFGASVNDYGTFDNEKNDRAYWKAETRYTIMGGETCNVSSYCTCKATTSDLVDYHWTCLNQDYNSDVLARWRTDNCYNAIVARLGYRLVMVDLFLSAYPKAGEPCQVTLRFYNTGYAAPMNPRDAKLVWKTPSGKLEETALGSDPRTWYTGYHTVSTTFVPSTASGTLYLELSDPLLPDRPEYCIALANESVFDAETGMNRLFEIKEK